MATENPNTVYWLLGGLLAVVMVVKSIEERDPIGRFLIWAAGWACRVLFLLALIPIVFLAFHLMAAMPISVAVIVGALIIVWGIRRSRPVMDFPPAQQPLHRYD